MPIEIAPNQIELSDLSAGAFYDASEAAIPMNGTPDSLNILPAESGNELRVRAGFTRLTGGRISLTTHWIRHLNYYETIVSNVRKRYLVAVLTDGTDAMANNIRIYVYDFAADTFTRVDTAGRSWAKGNREHWYAIAEGTYYGGTQGELPYSWHPTNGWNAAPTTPSTDTWVDSVAPSGGEVARNYAFKKGDLVDYSGEVYKAAKDIRFKVWKTGEGYDRNERVSNKVSVGGQTYWRSWECIKTHTATADKSPGDGAATDTYWKRVRLSDPVDADGDLTDDWWWVPAASGTGVGTYHGNRMFLRFGDSDNHSRVQFSAPAKPERDADIADLDFDPTDWAAVDDNEGLGGGWFNVPFPEGDQVRAFASLGNYLIICGWWSSMVLVGDAASGQLRGLGEYGACSNNSTTQLDGLVYGLSRSGELWRTDGTTIEPVPGMERMRQTFKDQLDDTMNGSLNWFPQVKAYAGKVYISFPDDGGSPTGSNGITYIYDPKTSSFWETDLHILGMAQGENAGSSRLFFSTCLTAAGTQRPCAFKLTDDPGQEAYTDDDYQAVSSSASTDDITWRWRSAWFQFGERRQERRIRRAWAKVAGEAAQSVVVRLFKNFIAGGSSYVTTVTRTLTGQSTVDAEYVEGAVSTTTAHSVSIRLSGTANALTAIHGVALDTEPARTRFHT